MERNARRYTHRVSIDAAIDWSMSNSTLRWELTDDAERAANAALESGGLPISHEWQCDGVVVKDEEFVIFMSLDEKAYQEEQNEHTAQPD